MYPQSCFGLLLKSLASVPLYAHLIAYIGLAQSCIAAAPSSSLLSEDCQHVADVSGKLVVAFLDPEEELDPSKRRLVEKSNPNSASRRASLFRTRGYTADKFIALPPWWTVGTPADPEVWEHIRANEGLTRQFDTVAALHRVFSGKAFNATPEGNFAIPFTCFGQSEQELMQNLTGAPPNPESVSVMPLGMLFQPDKSFCIGVPWYDSSNTPVINPIPPDPFVKLKAITFEDLGRIAGIVRLEKSPSILTLSQLADLLRVSGPKAYADPAIANDKLVLASSHRETNASILCQAVAASTMRAWEGRGESLVLVKVPLPRRLRNVSRQKELLDRALAGMLYKLGFRNDPVYKWVKDHLNEDVTSEMIHPSLRKVTETLFTPSELHEGRWGTGFGISLSLHIPIKTGQGLPHVYSDFIYYSPFMRQQRDFLRRLGGPYSYFLDKK